MAGLLREVPPNYERIHRHFSRSGNRVLALAFKKLPDVRLGDVAAISRDDLESNLEFAGFIVLHSPIKESSPTTVMALKNSSHHVIMITGDHALTACEVAKTLQITTHDRVTLILSVLDEDAKKLGWVPVRDEDPSFEYDESNFPDHRICNLCITGPALDFVSDDAFSQLVQRTKVCFAATSFST